MQDSFHHFNQLNKQVFGRKEGMRTWGSRGVLPHLAAVEFNFGGYQAKLGTAATRTLFLIKSQSYGGNCSFCPPPIYRFLQLHYNIAMLECLIWRASTFSCSWARKWYENGGGGELFQGALELFWALYRTAWGARICETAVQYLKLQRQDDGVKTCGHLLWKVRKRLTYKSEGL